MEKYGVETKPTEAKECPDCGSKLDSISPPHCPNCGTKPFEAKRQTSMVENFDTLYGKEEK